jgi:predicted PhzF superfamily epimerase YddE/YHI9
VPRLEVVRVFVGDDGRGGNPLGVFGQGHGIADDAMLGVAADLGFSETVFVEDAARGELRIFTPAVELPLAGHPLVGTAWLLHEQGAPVSVLRPPAGEVPTWREGDLTWIRADPAAGPAFEPVQVGSPAEVDEHLGAGSGPSLAVWAWEDEAAGRMRIRVFPVGVGIAEDEATGAAGLRMGALLGRPLRLRQGVGSRLDVRPGPSGTVEVGGRVEPVETRDYAVARR